MKEWGIIQMDQHKYKKEEKDLVDRTAESVSGLQQDLDKIAGVKKRIDIKKFKEGIEKLKLWLKENNL